MVARSVNRARYGKADAVKRYIDGNDTPGKYQRHDATKHSSILRGKPCIPWFYAGQPHRITIRLSGTYSLYMEPYHNCLSNVLFCRDSSPRRPIAEYRHCRCRSIKFRALTGVMESDRWQEQVFLLSHVSIRNAIEQRDRSCEMKNTRKRDELQDIYRSSLLVCLRVSDIHKGKRT